MRRLTVRRSTSLALSATLIAVLLALLVLGTTGPAAADEAFDGSTIVLAVDGEPLGPEPQPRNAETNPAGELRRYMDQEIPFTWGAAWLLTLGGGVALVLLGLLYELLVRRPAREAAEKS